MGGDMCIDVAGLVGQITVTGGCCLNGDEMIAHTFDASGILVVFWWLVYTGGQFLLSSWCIRLLHRKVDLSVVVEEL